MNMEGFPRISIVIPTQGRPKDLAELLLTILDQSYFPLEVIIIDDSAERKAKQVTNLFKSDFERFGCVLKYVRGSGDGLPTARNLGAKTSRGDVILFLDDDTLLEKNTVEALTAFLKGNPKALGIQPKILSSTVNIKGDRLSARLENAVYKALMLTYRAEDKQVVRRSGKSISLNNLTKVITVQRLSGCCCCLKPEVFERLKYDENLKLWGYMEDLDFSYRLHKKYPQFLYATPDAKILHKESPSGRLPSQLTSYMTSIYWFYVFFKDIFENSILNLVAFIWALIGNLVAVAGGLIIKRKPKHEWWCLIHLLGSYATAFRNLKNILMRRLEFFNNNLNRQKVA